MANTVEQELQHYLLQLNEAEKKSVLELLKTFLGERSQKTQRITLDQYNQELAEAEEQYKNGEVISHEELLKQVKEW
ncbi:MAG TPA: hypothetical protein VMR70_07460 [Flavisolibacter sp.]|nr:hypothetical protein [Flavisolibacter sp.]